MRDGLAAAHPESRFLHCYRPHRFLAGIRAARPENARAALLYPPWFMPRRAGIFHGLNQRLPAARFRHTVCTFHDLFVLSGDYSTAEFRARFAAQARAAASASDLIICVSDFTASQVRGLLGVENHRILVVHHGVAVPAPAESAARQPVVLHVGAIQKRKNIARLVAAFERALPEPWRLVLAGSAGYDAAAIFERIERSPARARIQVTGYLPDSELRGWYQRSRMLAFPSLDEGFGIPALEAMAHGLPVIASNRAALPEVCGDAAVLIDPEQEEELAAALQRLARSQDDCDDLALRGRRRAREFSWERAVEQTWAAYLQLADG
jgi:glycosyltransferase involved in cell wall biosynthesis